MAAELADVKRQLAELRRLTPTSLSVTAPGSVTADVASYADAVLKWPNGAPFVWYVINQNGNRIFQTFPVTYADAPTNHVVATAAWGLYNATDNANNEVSPDALAGWGLAKPYLALPMYPQFVPVVPGTASNGAYLGYYSINTAASGMAQGNVLWHGRIAMVTHPKLYLNFLGGAASGAVVPTYTLWVNLVQVDSWTPSFGTSTRIVDLTAVKHFTDVPVDIKVNWTNTGQIAAQVDNCYLRQS
jgi:hypothetical protein